MRAILRREIYAYFASPVGFVFLAVFWFFAGFYLFTGALVNGSSNIAPVFSALVNIIMALTPLLTMRLMSDDKRQKTDQLLLSAPISFAALVLGKFFAALFVYMAGISITLLFALTLSVTSGFSSVNWALVLGNWSALFLLGASFIAIGEFISSLTDNMAIAALGAFSAMLSLFLLDALGNLLPFPRWTQFVNALSFIRRFSPFSNGIFKLQNIFYFISVTFLFLFLTASHLERRRYK